MYEKAHSFWGPSRWRYSMLIFFMCIEQIVSNIIYFLFYTRSVSFCKICKPLVIKNFASNGTQPEKFLVEFNFTNSMWLTTRLLYNIRLYAYECVCVFFLYIKRKIEFWYIWWRPFLLIAWYGFGTGSIS